MSILDRIQGPDDLKQLSISETAELAGECRQRIIEVITKTGGHLASNLGVVELTLAIHRVFDSPRDRIVWDTSNQCYTHKLVTGRAKQFGTIRTPGGLSGFAEPAESAHDTLAAGHAGTGLSYAVGMATALQRDPSEPYVLAVVGDGALTSGPSYEALNNIVHLKPKRLIVIFNDNGWSISENVGWLTQWRNRLVLHPSYQKLTEAGQKLFSKLPHGEQAWELARRIKTSVEGVFLPNMIWEEMGLQYIGPIDGHDLAETEDALRKVKEISHDGTPVVLHVLTHKGKGMPDAEDNPCKFHQPGTPSPAAGASLTYSQVFAQTLIKMMREDPRIVAISAAMLVGTALTEVKKEFPDRVYDVGIAEEHAVIMAAGMAKAGWRPVVAIYSTFLQRSFDQIIHDVALQELPVTLAIDRAGLVGDDGKTHQGVFDITYTRCVPNMTVAAPKDENELQHMLYTAIRSGRPWAIRYPRGLGLGVPMDQALKEIPVGRGESLSEGRDLMFFAYGATVPVAGRAAARLRERGVDCGVANARFAKPLDLDLLRSVANASARVLTLEEHLLCGGFGSGVLEAADLLNLPVARIKIHGIPDMFIEHGPAAFQRANLKLDEPGVVARALELFPDLAGVGHPPRIGAVGRRVHRDGPMVNGADFSGVRVEKLVVASLRGFCAGVVRAIDVVEKALDVCGGPVFVRKEIIHNRYVVDELRAKGAAFVEEVDEVPDGAWLIYSAHGIAPEVRQRAEAKRLRTIDATCPLVTKVHLEALAFARKGYTIVYIGHRNHDEAIGTLGEAPDSMRLVESVADAESVEVKDPDRVVYLTQTTLSIDDARDIVEALRRRFPKLVSPPKSDICYATQNRQDAVKEMAPHVDLMLVLGAPNSSNSLRMCEVARDHGTRSELIERAADIRSEWLSGVRTLGLTASASAPEILVQEVVAFARETLGVSKIEEFATVSEDVHFALPPELKPLLEVHPGKIAS